MERKSLPYIGRLWSNAGDIERMEKGRLLPHSTLAAGCAVRVGTVSMGHGQMDRSRRLKKRDCR